MPPLNSPQISTVALALGVATTTVTISLRMLGKLPKTHPLGATLTLDRMRLPSQSQASGMRQDISVQDGLKAN